MSFKIDTSDNYSVITPTMAVLSANVAEPLKTECKNLLQGDAKNIILNLKNIEDVTADVCVDISKLQQSFYEANASFIICEMTKQVEQKFDDCEVLELLNTTPTQSEAVDILQMEIIERELLDSDDVEFETD